MTVLLPVELEKLIREETERFSLANLRESAQSLSSGYRDRSHIPHTLSPIERAAYVSVRMPATYAAASCALGETLKHVASESVQSLLDVGSGPGTGGLAASHFFPEASVTFVERDAGWRDFCLRAASACRFNAEFTAGSLQGFEPRSTFDAVTAVYALNELDAKDALRAVEVLWQATRSLLVIVEPGTPAGFALVEAIRTLIIEQHGFIVAPCPHDAACPMQENDWCHRPVRVPRSALHRSIKSVDLAYEDEKFCYVAISKQPPLSRALGRIVARPVQGSGHVHLDICDSTGIKRRTYSKKSGALYRAAKRCEWGDEAPG